jgi:hypothetical protein
MHERLLEVASPFVFLIGGNGRQRCEPLSYLLVLTAALGASLGLMLGRLVPITRLPLTYAAEGLRWATMPPPHVTTLPPGLVLAVLCASLAASLAVGLCQFRRRVLR